MARRMRPFVIGGEIVALSARGLKVKSDAIYWVPSDHAVARGYLPRTIRLYFNLHLDIETDRIVVNGEPDELKRLCATCEQHWAQMRAWLGSPEMQSMPVFDGTFGSLIRCYQTDPESPYHEKRQSTRECYDGWCMTITRAFGKQRIDHTKPREVRRHFKAIMEPAEPGGRSRVRLAKGCIKQMLPILLGYGVEIGIPACATLLHLIADLDIRVPSNTLAEWNAAKPQRLIMGYAHAEAIVNEGIRRATRRSLSVAIGVAAQFEFTIAQIDVIGWWEKRDRNAPPLELSNRAIVCDGEIWHPGLCYEDFIEDMTLDMRRSKNGRGGVFEVEEYPLFMRALAAIPSERRAGPVAIDDHGYPFFGRRAYNRAYREIADAVGVPQAVWNMNARHGGATEADDAGAELSDISTHLQHANTATTKKHYIKPTAEPNRRVARLRVAHRDRKETA